MLISTFCTNSHNNPTTYFDRYSCFVDDSNELQINVTAQVSQVKNGGAGSPIQVYLPLESEQLTLRCVEASPKAAASCSPVGWGHNYSSEGWRAPANYVISPICNRSGMPRHFLRASRQQISWEVIKHVTDVEVLAHCFYSWTMKIQLKSIPWAWLLLLIN